MPPRKPKLQGYADQLRTLGGTKAPQMETVTEPIYTTDPKTGKPMYGRPMTDEEMAGMQQ